MKHNYTDSFEYIIKKQKTTKELIKLNRRKKILSFIEKLLIKIGL